MPKNFNYIFFLNLTTMVLKNVQEEQVFFRNHPKVDCSHCRKQKNVNKGDWDQIKTTTSAYSVYIFLKNRIFLRM